MMGEMTSLGREDMVRMVTQELKRQMDLESHASDLSFGQPGPLLPLPEYSSTPRLQGEGLHQVRSQVASLRSNWSWKCCGTLLWLPVALRKVVTLGKHTWSQITCPPTSHPDLNDGSVFRLVRKA